MTQRVNATTVDVSLDPGSALVATGKTVITVSGTDGILPSDTCRWEIWSRSDTAPFVLTYSQSGFGRIKIDFAASDEWYYVIEVNGNTVSLSDVPE